MALRSGPRRDDDVPIQRLHLWQIQGVRDALLVGLVAGLVWVGYAMRAVTVPLLTALLLAYLFEPMVARLSARRNVSRPVVVGGLLATVGVLFIAVLAVVIPIIVTQTADLVSKYQQGQFRRTAVELSQHLPAPWRDQAAELITHLPVGPEEPDTPPPADAAAPDAAAPEGPTLEQQNESRIRAIVREEMALGGVVADEPQKWLGVAKGGAKAVGRMLAGIVELGFLLFLIPFYFFFFSVWYPSVVRFGRSLIPESNRSTTLELLQKMDGVVAGFVRGRIVISMIMGVMLAVGWRVVGVPYSIVLGLVVGLFCAVPYLGGVGIPIAVAFLAFKELAEPHGEAMAWYWIIFWPTAWFAVVQFIEGYLLTPMIAGKATNLDPVTILVAVLAGGSIMGIYGMLLGIPVAACIKVLFSDVVLPQIRAWTSGEASDPLPIKKGG